MKLLLTAVLIASLILGGCAATEHEISSYHSTVAQTNTQVLKIVERQTDAARDRRANEMVYFSQAMVSAASTENPTDDAVIAFAWGFTSGRADVMEIPSLQYPAAPVTDVDRVKAWTPMVGMALPFLHPLLYGGSGNSGTEIVATDQATIMLDSGNAGSYNKVSGGPVLYDANGNPIVPENTGPGVGNAQVINKHDDLILYNEGGGDLNGQLLGYNGGPEQLPTDPEPTEPGGETCESTGGYLSPNGRVYADPNFTCSCGSRLAGDC